MKDTHTIKETKQTIDDCHAQIDQLQGDLKVALEAMEKMEKALKNLKKKRWWRL